MFCVLKTAFKIVFQFFPLIFVTVQCLPHFSHWNTSCLTLKSNHFCIISSPIFKKKVRVFFASLHFSCFECAFLNSVGVLLPLWFEKYNVHTRVYFILVSVLWLRISVFYCKLIILLLFIWNLCSVLCFMNVLLHSYHVLGILSHYLSFESLWCSLPTWFWVTTVHHHIRLPIPLNSSVLFMISWYWPGSCFCDWVKSPCFTFLYLNLFKLMCVPCGIAFGSLLCVCSLADDSLFL